MKKAVLAPDSFKGTMGALEVCEIMERAIRRVFPEAELISIPVADGGEGSVQCFLRALGGSLVRLEASGPFFEPVGSFFGMLDDGRTAVLEVASCAGLPMVEGREAPDRTTTYGLGEMMLEAASRGAGKLIVGLGGSATNDGGCGAAAAAGLRFLDGAGREFVPTGGTLGEVAGIDAGGLSPLLSGLEIVAMCDIDNPLCGERGAARVFAPQKGADGAMVERLDAGLLHLAGVIRRDLGPDVLDMPGAGAAGGLGAGMKAFFGARMQMGIQAVLDAVNFDECLRGADLALTGEGRLDRQSLRGKVVIGVAKRAKAANVPVAAIVGDVGDGIEEMYENGVSGIFSINRIAADFSVVRRDSPKNLELTVENLMRFLKAAKYGG
ncbi:MAG: glycerate kinase [Clostridiales Family XIII bacterium]|jgi:glycerate kinase|nr:glycerate kinase [Clostridiales Family XIII bacterium]